MGDRYDNEDAARERDAVNVEPDIDPLLQGLAPLRNSDELTDLTRPSAAPNADRIARLERNLDAQIAVNRDITQQLADLKTLLRELNNRFETHSHSRNGSLASPRGRA